MNRPGNTTPTIEELEERLKRTQITACNLLDKKNAMIDQLTTEKIELKRQLEDLEVDKALTAHLLHGTSEHTAQLEKRLAEFQDAHKAFAHDQLEIAKLLDSAGIEHSGFKKQAPRVAMLIERLHTCLCQRAQRIAR